VKRRRHGLLLTLALNATPKFRSKIIVHSVPDFEDGALAILEELLARGHRPIVLLEEPLSRPAAVTHLAEAGVTFATKHSNVGRFHYLTARVVFTTHGAYRPHAPARSQTLVHIGHGEPLGKSAGYWIGGLAARATFAVAGSTVGRAFRCVQQDVAPQQVLLVGSPRNDRLIRSDRNEVRRKVAEWLPDPTETLFIWLPTYRRHFNGTPEGVELETGLPLDLASLRRVDAWLEDRRAAMIVKKHPLNHSDPVDGHGRIRVLDDAAFQLAGLSLYRVLVAADCLITDASSVWFDFLLTGRPLICCFPDIHEYRKSRTLNLEPYEEWFPGPFVNSADELLEELAHVDSGGDRYADARGRLTRALHLHRDGQSSRRLLDALGL
jgi:CDP-glycerol glycerophosphotransferase